MKNHTFALLFVVLVLTAALIVSTGYAWRLQNKLNDAEADLQAINPVRISRGVSWLPAKERQGTEGTWRLCVLPYALLHDPDLPEKVKKSVEHIQREARADPNFSVRP